MSKNDEFSKKIIEGQECLFSNSYSNSSPLTFIILPGNPSVTELYIKFATLFIQKFNYPVIISSLASNKGDGYSMEKAIKLKQNFFEYLFNINPKGKYIVLGHSIGNYILIKSLQKMKENKQIIGIYCLFPALLNCYKCFPLLYKVISYNYLVISICAFFCNLFKFMPLCLVILIFRMLSNVPKNYVECLARNASQSFTKQMLLLTKDEGDYVKEYSDDFIKFMNENSYRLRMIYGKNDRYGNENVANQFHKLVPNAILKIIDIVHAFVLGFSQEVFDEISDLVKKDIIKFEENKN